MPLAARLHAQSREPLPKVTQGLRRRRPTPCSTTSRITRSTVETCLIRAGFDAQAPARVVLHITGYIRRYAGTDQT